MGWLGDNLILILCSSLSLRFFHLMVRVHPVRDRPLEFIILFKQGGVEGCFVLFWWWAVGCFVFALFFFWTICFWFVIFFWLLYHLNFFVSWAILDYILCWNIFLGLVWSSVCLSWLGFHWQVPCLLYGLIEGWLFVIAYINKRKCSQRESLLCLVVPVVIYIYNYIYIICPLL